MYSNYIDENEYTYIGKINGGSNGNFAISKDSEGITGFIGLSSDHFTFYPLGGNEVVFIKDAQVTSTGADCAIVGEDGGSTAPDAAEYCSNASNDCYAFIDIVAVIHPSAAGTIAPGFATLTKLNMNTVLLNSGIVNKEVRVRLFNAFGPFIFPLVGAVSDINTLQNTPEIVSFRKDAGADILILLIGAAYTGPIFGVSPISGDGYAIVAAPFAFGGRFTLAHEVGHILGAQHNWTSNGGNYDEDDCAHGLRFTGTSQNIHTTIMALLPTPGERIPYYSNPYVYFDGVPTGIEGSASSNTANNTRKIKNKACTVQSWNKPQHIYGQIEGPGAMCPGDNIKYESLVTPGTVQGSSNYSWQCLWSYASSPAGPFTLLNTNLCEAWVSANLGTPGHYLYLRLTVYPNIGNIWTTTKQIWIHGSCLQGDNLEDRSASADVNAVKGESFYLVPNPAGNSVSVGVDDQIIQQVTVFSADGAVVAGFTFPGKAEKLVKLDLSNIPAGIYLVRLVTNTGVFSKVLSHVNQQ